MMHPATELRFINSEIGYGVFARAPIARGTVVWTLCHFDMIFSPAEAAAFPPSYQPLLDRYAYIDGNGSIVLCWDHGRYVNHSCDPVMLGVGGSFEIAVRDIEKDEELTCEYATLNLLEPMDCSCRTAGCRGAVGSGDLLALWPDIDRRVAAALPFARSEPQPLVPFARDPDLFWAWVDGRAALPSSREFYVHASAA